MLKRLDRFKVAILTVILSAISGVYAEYQLVARTNNPSAPELVEKLVFKNYDVGWLYLNGKQSLVVISSNFTLAKVRFGDGSLAECK